MMKLIKFLFIHKEWVIISGCLLIYLLLLFKDPFSQRTLIPNFEPYPDTFYYLVPPLRLIKGEGFYLSREGRIFKNSIPPLYSLAILPFLFANPDPRMVYYANIFFSLISVTLFLLILRKITENVLIISLVLFLYVTNYFLFWMPTLAMAENLALPLYMLAIILFLRKDSFLNYGILGFISLCIFMTKSASLPVTVSILVLSSFRIFSQNIKIKWKIKAIFYLMMSFSSPFLLYAWYLYLRNNYNIFSALPGYLALLSGANAYDIKVGPTGWASFDYMKKNLPLYISSILGDRTRFLWDMTPLVPKYIALASIVGIFIGLVIKQYRNLRLILVVMVGSTIIFMSTFNTYDSRYIYIAIPSLLLGFSIFLSTLIKTSKGRIKTLIKGGILAIFIFYIFSNFIRIKSQISLNLKYAETPWYYVSILKMNEYFTEDKIINGKKPVVISALPPYLVDFFSNDNYTLLPLSYEQEFRNNKEIVWGPNDYSDLPKLYTEYIQNGYKVYVSRYGLGNESYTNRDFDIILNTFDVKLVQPGCFEQCNIYTIKLKSNKL